MHNVGLIIHLLHRLPKNLFMQFLKYYLCRTGNIIYVEPKILFMSNRKYDLCRTGNNIYVEPKILYMSTQKYNLCRTEEKKRKVNSYLKGLSTYFGWPTCLKRGACPVHNVFIVYEKIFQISLFFISKLIISRSSFFIKVTDL